MTSVYSAAQARADRQKAGSKSKGEQYNEKNAEALKSAKDRAMAQAPADKPVGSPSGKSSYSPVGTDTYTPTKEGETPWNEQGPLTPNPMYPNVLAGGNSSSHPYHTAGGQSYVDRASAAVKSKYGDELPPQTMLSGDLGRGQIAGLESAEAVYGITKPELGYETQGILAKRRARMEGTSPEDTDLRESRNRRVRMARAGGRNPAQVEQIKRDSERDIATAKYSRQGQSLTEYQGLIGKMIAGTLQSEKQMAGLAASGQVVAPASTDIGGGTVICTELFKQGYMDHETYELDKQYGAIVRATRPHVYIGYRLLADPVVRLMQKSKLFCNLISIPALCWAEYMSGKNNLIGAVIYKVGEKLCGFIGKLKGVRSVI